HRQFIPVNSYATADGFIYIAVGSDAQWARLIEAPLFASLDEERYLTNEGRRASQADLHRAIGALTAEHTSAALSAALAAAAIPHSPITPIEEVADLPLVADTALKTTAPDGREIRLPPPAVPVAHLDSIGRELPFAPSYGEQTTAILGEAGLSEAAIADLRASGAIA
ncbi:MAG: CoA transferase, partial [Planctomycetota bacterium]|nr:CoA transferase [Planctomycetota bacterium]